MSKFKNRLASIVLSTITLAGGVTTCLVSNSAVHQCQANIKNKEMKKLINEALKDCFKQNTSLPQITAVNLKTVLQNALDQITHGNNGTPLTENERNNLQTQVNTFLFVLSDCLATCLWFSQYKTTREESKVIMNVIQNYRTTAPGSTMSFGFIEELKKLIEEQVPSRENYFPENFFNQWWEQSCLHRDSTALQALIKNPKKEQAA